CEPKSGPRLSTPQALVVQRRGFRTRNAATSVRVRPGALAIDCSLTIETTPSAHDVAAAYCLAMADVRVRLPLGAFASACGKAWQFRLLRKQEIVGSNPTAPTGTPAGCQLRRGNCW